MLRLLGEGMRAGAARVSCAAGGIAGAMIVDVTMGFYMLLFGEIVVAEAEASQDCLLLKLMLQVTAAVVTQK